MPLLDWSLEETWRANYQSGVTDPATGQVERWVTYGRDYYTNGGREPNMPFFDARAATLIALGIAAADRVFVGGCGFGYLIERLKARGLTNVWGIENAAWITDRRATESNGTVLWANLSIISNVNTLRNALRTMTGGATFQWVITEDMLTSCTDVEAGQVMDAAQAVLVNGAPTSNIVHLVWPGPFFGTPFNAKTLAQWKALRPAHTFMNAENNTDVL